MYVCTLGREKSKFFLAVRCAEMKFLNFFGLKKVFFEIN